jgi:N-acetylated-alpha-linked acidic dipeptidase
MFGVQPHHYQQLHQEVDEWKEYLGLIDSSSPDESSRPHLPNFPLFKLIKAAKRVKKANSKIIAFERGFISESGIKEREWYKHLGVAPGKWLGKFSVDQSFDPSYFIHIHKQCSTGYGATTFPALTEALTIDNNVTSANEEASRLTELLHKLAHHIGS